VTRTRKQPPAAAHRRAWAASIALHAAGLAGAAAAGGAALDAVSWDGDAGVPIQLTLRADVPLPEFTPTEPVPQPVPPQNHDCSDDLPELPVSPSEWMLPRPVPDTDGEHVPDVPTEVPPHRPPPASLAFRYRVPTPLDRDEIAPQDAPDGALVQPSPLPGVNRPPLYPFVAWRRGIEGQVTVILEIDTAGEVDAAHVEQSSGSSLLDDAALSKLSSWRFQPAMQGGRAVRSTFRQVVIFRLGAAPELPR